MRGREAPDGHPSPPPTWEASILSSWRLQPDVGSPHFLSHPARGHQLPGASVSCLPVLSVTMTGQGYFHACTVVSPVRF